MSVSAPLRHHEGPLLSCRVLASLVSLALPLMLLCMAAIGTRPAYAANTNSYKIIYKLNGGSQPKKQVKKVKKGKTLKVSKIKKPTRAGYTFKGWYTNKKLTKKAKSVKGVSKKSKRTLYAKWKAKTYSIAYLTNGGTLPSSCTKTYKITKAVKLPTPTRAGYSFIGWYRDASFTSPIDQIDKGSTGNITLYARWQERFFIAHRGYHVGIPQNSVDAVRAAAEKGFKHVEADVRFTSDGVPVLAHDATLRVWETVVPEPDPDPGSDSEGGTDEQDAQAEGPQPAAPAEGFGAEEPVYAEVIEEDGYREVVDVDGYVEILEDEEGSSEDDAPSEVEGLPSRVSSPDEEGEQDVQRILVTWAISEHTYQELCNAELVQDDNHPSGPEGTNISTFEQLLESCAEPGLYLRIDVKAGDREQVTGLVDAVRVHGLAGTASWCTGSLTILDYLSAYDNTLPLAQYLAPITKAKLAKLQAIGKRGNPLVTHTSLAKLTPAVVALCKEARIPLGVYGVADETYASKVDPYIYELTIDGLAGEHAPQTF